MPILEVYNGNIGFFFCHISLFFVFKFFAKKDFRYVWLLFVADLFVAVFLHISVGSSVSVIQYS